MDLKSAIDAKNQATLNEFDWIKKNAPNVELLPPRLWSEDDTKEVADQLRKFEREFRDKVNETMKDAKRLMASKTGQEIFWDVIATSWNVMCIQSAEAK